MNASKRVMPSAEWPPTEAQVQAWLGGFKQATCRQVVVHHPTHRGAGFAERFLMALGGLFLAVAGVCLLLPVAIAVTLGLYAGASWLVGRYGLNAAGIEALLALIVALFVASDDYGRPDPPRRARRQPKASAPPSPRMTITEPSVLSTYVAADGRGVTVRTDQVERREQWSDLAAVEYHGAATVLRFGYGGALRLPGDPAVQPVLRAARSVLTARSAYDRALLARMERGLSRPTTAAPGGRGLSLVGPS